MLRGLSLHRRLAVTLSSARTLLEQRSLSPGVTAPLQWSAADQVAGAGAPSRSPYSPVQGNGGNGGNGDFAPEMAPFAPENMPFAHEIRPHSPIPVLATGECIPIPLS